MPQFAVLRLAKIMTLASLDRSSRHAARTQPVSNADPAGEIVWLSPQTDPALAIRSMINGLDRPPRRNSVLAIEVVATASPDWFVKGDPAAFDRSVMAWAETTFGPGRVAAAVSHREERTPHVHLFVCPWTESPVKKRGRKPKDGRAIEAKPCRPLDCAGLVGTDRAALSRMQDGFAAALAPLGLARGQRRSLARHTELSVWRGQQLAAARQEVTALRSTAKLTQWPDETLRIDRRRICEYDDDRPASAGAGAFSSGAD